MVIGLAMGNPGMNAGTQGRQKASLLCFMCLDQICIYMTLKETRKQTSNLIDLDPSMSRTTPIMSK